jgi:hypothetical protein
MVDCPNQYGDRRSDWYGVRRSDWDGGRRSGTAADDLSGTGAGDRTGTGSVDEIDGILVACRGIVQNSRKTPGHGALYLMWYEMVRYASI